MKHKKFGREDLPLLPGMEEFFQKMSIQHFTDNQVAYSSESAKNDPFLQRICECCNFTSKWQMPIVSPIYDKQVLQLEIMGYDRLAHDNSLNYGVHFYCDDHKILSSLRSVESVYNRIKNHPFIIGPDYSIKMNMPFPQKLSNSFYIKLVTAWYQHMGLIVVPNIVWAEDEHIGAYLEGYPIGSIVAINKQYGNRS